MIAARGRVREFLEEFKQAAEDELHVIPRKINLDFLTRHGFTPGERREALLGLRVQDYVKGPEEDDRARGPRDIWFFGVEYQGMQVYIKLQLAEEGDAILGRRSRRAKCLSFHEARWPLRYPYGGESNG